MSSEALAKARASPLCTRRRAPRAAARAADAVAPPCGAAQGLDATAARIAPHADACLTRFERFALDTVCAVPSALCEQVRRALQLARSNEQRAAAPLRRAPARRAHAPRARQAELPPLRYSEAEEAALDARLEAARSSLAAAHAATAAMRAERERLCAELAAGGAAAERLRTLAAAAGQENGKDATEHAVKAVVAMADFVPLLHKAEALCATAPLALAPPQAADGALARCGEGCSATTDALHPTPSQLRRRRRTRRRGGGRRRARRWRRWARSMRACTAARHSLCTAHAPF